MNEEKDIKDFVAYGEMLSFAENYRMTYPVKGAMYRMYERSALFLEFMAAAFIKETGLDPRNVELVCQYGIDEIRWKFVEKK